MKSDNIIGTNIKSFRDRRGIRQEDLAQFLRVKREVVSYYETGARDVPIDNLNKIADLFGIDLATLLEEDIDIQKVDVAFAFRTSEFSAEDMKVISEFGKIVKNYIKINKLSQNEH
jgi:transcriptional regulator with XRE-family HTH domain